MRLPRPLRQRGTAAPMNAFADLVMVLAIPLSLLAFQLLGARRGAFATVVFGFLFLPVHVLQFSGLPNLDRAWMVSGGLVLGCLLHARGDLSRLRLQWCDLPVLVYWGVAPVSALANGNGAWDAFSVATTRGVTLLVPWFCGRALCRDAAAMRELLEMVVLGGLCYLPLCWFELRMSPQLHYLVYGQSQHSFQQTIRFGGYRPMVFLYHGLTLSLWMASATLGSFVLWRRLRTRSIGGVPAGVAFWLLLATTLACKSTGAAVLMLLGLLLLGTWNGWLWLATTLLAPFYVGTRMLLAGPSNPMAGWFSFFGEERFGSISFRWANEDLLVHQSLLQPLLGYSSWLVTGLQDADGNALSYVTDSAWIIALVSGGMIGLGGFLLFMIVPVVRGALAMARSREHAAQVGVAMIVFLYLGDELFNAFLGPVYYLAAGAAAGYVPGVVTAVVRAATGVGRAVLTRRGPHVHGLRPRASRAADTDIPPGIQA